MNVIHDCKQDTNYTTSLRWSDVAIGMLVRGLPTVQEVTSPSSCATCLVGLNLALSTWIPHAAGVELLALGDCTISSPPPPTIVGEDSKPPTHLHVECYGRPAMIGRTLWQKTAALRHGLTRRLPSKRIYLKVDTDTLLLPSSLLGFLNQLSNIARPAYFGLAVGGAAASKNRTLCLERHCLFASPAWRARAREAQLAAYGTERAVLPALRHAPGQTVHYAAGALYGLDRVALRAAVDSDCIPSVASALQVMAGARQVRLFEDEAVGMCMQMLAVPLHSCRCFHSFPPLSPCEHQPAAKRCADRTCRAGKMLSVHPLKGQAQFLAWWHRVGVGVEAGQ
jgi:hypothetical protein